jgi:hypothetical protein
MVVFCTSFMPERCATMPRFVTDETGGSSICKRRGNRPGNRPGATIDLDDRLLTVHLPRTPRAELQWRARAITLCANGAAGMTTVLSAY